MKNNTSKNKALNKFDFFDFNPMFWQPFFKTNSKPKFKKNDASHLKHVDILIYDESLNDLKQIDSDLKALNHGEHFAWQTADANLLKTGVHRVLSSQGTAVVIVQKKISKSLGHGKAFDFPTAFRIRNAIGGEIAALREHKIESVHVEFKTSDPKIAHEAIIGIILGLYQFSQIKMFKKLFCPNFTFSTPCSEEILYSAGILASGTNIARHLVNVPPSDLTPKTYSACIQKNFKNLDSKLQLDIWNSDKLFEEGCLLHHAVGRGAEHGPELIHFQWRPAKTKTDLRIPAIVGKGITFDTGGLDIKNASGMRFMKKDMGGSASVVGLVFWTALSNLEHAADFYIATADNAVSEKSYRPGDIIRSRAGHFVEIHNTDAEGRLVLADAFNVALTKYAKKPSCIINLATLTGAMRAAFGPMVAGFCSNDDNLSKKVYDYGCLTGESVWRMPLISEYWNYLKSHAADFSNASDSGFAGAITAGLFLQKFVDDVPWVHFDINCWSDKTNGAIADVGGNGQCVMLLSEILKAGNL